MSDRPRVLDERAPDAVASGLAAQAIALRAAELERTFDDDPTSEVFFELARAKLQLGQTTAAVHILETGLAIHLHHVEGRSLLAESLLLVGRSRSGARHAANVLRSEPTHLPSMRTLARALLSDDKPEEAWIVLRRALEHDPSDALTQGLQAEALMQLQHAAPEPGIGVREHNGVVIDLSDRAAAALPAPTAGFTGYIRAIAGPSTQARGAQGVIIDEDYEDELTEGGASEVDPVRPPNKLRLPAHPATGGLTRESGSPGDRLRSHPTTGEQTSEGISPSVFTGAADRTRMLDPVAELAGGHDGATELPGTARGGRSPRAFAHAASRLEFENLRPLQVADAAPPTATPPPRPPATSPPKPGVPAGVRLELPKFDWEPEDTRTRPEAPLTTPDLGPVPRPLPRPLPRVEVPRFIAPVEPPPTAEMPVASLPEVPDPGRPGTVKMGKKRPSATPTISREAMSQTPTAESAIVMPQTVSATGRASEPTQLSAAAVPSVVAARPSNPQRRPVSNPRPRPASTPAPAPETARDLLDIPLDPLEFDDAPPAPPSRGAHPLPADLDGPEGTPPPMRLDPNFKASRAPPPVPRASSEPAPPPVPRASGEPAPPPPRPKRHADVSPQVERARVAERVASPPVAALPPDPPPPRPEPKASRADPPAPRARAAPVAVVPEAPNYQDEFASYFDARTADRGAVPDAVADIVGAHRGHRAAVPPTIAMSSEVPLPARRHRLDRRTIGGVVLGLALLFSLVLTWRYRSAKGQFESAILESTARLVDGNHAGRVVVAQRLAEVDLHPGPMARFGNRLARALGRPGFDDQLAQITALIARTEAERWARYGDHARGDSARAAVTQATTDAAARPETAMAQAWMALGSDQPDQARRQLEVLAAQRPTDAEAHYLLGVAALRTGQREQAVEQLRAAVQLDPAHVGALGALADYKALRGELAAALDGYRDILQNHSPSHLETLVAQARLHIVLGKRDTESVSDLQRLLQEPSANPTQRALVHEALGQHALRRNDLDSARRSFTAATREAPEDSRFALGLASLDIKELKLDDAERVLEEAISRTPTDPSILQSLALVRLMRGDPQGALKYINASPKLDGAILLAKGRALLELGEPKDAETALRAAREEDPGLLDIRIYRTLALYMRSQTAIRLDELKTLRRGGAADERLDDRSLPFRAYAAALGLAGDLRGATAAYQRALEIDARDFRASFGLCQLAIREGEIGRGTSMCRSAVQVNPSYLPAADQLAALSETRGDPQAVIAVLGPLIARNGEPPPAVRRLARAYVHTGDPERASALLDGQKATTEAATRRYVTGLVNATRHKLADALVDLNAAADELPNDYWVQLANADALMQDGKVDMAGGYYRRALVAGPGAEAALGAARAWAARERWRDTVVSADDAIVRARQSVAAAAITAEALVLRAEARVRLGEPRAAARSAVEEALRLAPNCVPVRLAAGRFAEASGEQDTAATHYRRAADLSPQSAEAPFYLGRLLASTRDRREEGRSALERAVSAEPDGRFGVLAEQLLRRR